MKSITIIISLVFTGFFLYPQQNLNHPDPFINKNKAILAKAAQETNSPQNKYCFAQPYDIKRVKTNKYRILGDMTEVSSGGILQHYDSTKYDYIFNDYSTDIIYFRWDVIHWAMLSKMHRTYDQNYNVLIDEGMNFDGTDWIGEYQYVYTYDQGNRLLSSTYQEFNNATVSWDDLSREIYRYNIRGNQIEDLYQNWSSGAWVNASRFIQNFDDNNNIILSISQYYDSGSWQNSFKSERTYNNQNFIITNFGYIWNATTSVWENSSKLLFDLDANNNVITTTMYKWSSGVWVEEEKYSYTYNSANIMLSEIHQVWNGLLSQWVNDEKYEFAFNGNNKVINEYRYEWNSGTSSWDNDFKFLYTYDSNSNRLSETNAQWFAGAWVDNYRNLYTYDSNNNTVLQDYDTWNALVSVWNTQNRTHYYWEIYEENAGVKNNEAVSGINIFPSPASSFIKITGPVEIIKVTIYNPAGQKVYDNETGSNSVNIELDNFESGLYVIQALTKNGMISKKVQINK